MFLRQVSALKAVPAPSKHREIFGNCTGGRELKTSVLLYREEHDPEMIVSMDEIVEMMGTNVVW